MTNNVKVAATLLEMHSKGMPLTIAKIAVDANVHAMNVGDFLRYWVAVGWLTKRREGRRMIFSMTKNGEEGFATLVHKSG